jgi:hypothetical protein
MRRNACGRHGNLPLQGQRFAVVASVYGKDLTTMDRQTVVDAFFDALVTVHLANKSGDAASANQRSTLLRARHEAKNILALQSYNAVVLMAHRVAG